MNLELMDQGLLLCLLLDAIGKNSNTGEKDTNISDGLRLVEPQAQDMPQHEADHRSQPPADDRVSNLEFENKLLKKEVSSLNEEMVSVVQRAKEAERSKY